MNAPHNAWISVKERSGVAQARLHAKALARELGLPPEAAERAAIVVTEAATNIVKHAHGGRMLLVPVAAEAGPKLAIVAADEGPGIAEIDKAMTDGVSTVGSRGIGLGAISRLADAYDIFTTGSTGTIVTAEIVARRGPPEGTHLDLAALLLNYPGQTVCGDAWAVRRRPEETMLIVCDGLGHGPNAAEAARAIVEAFAGSDEVSPGALLQLASQEAAPTRGAVAMVCAIHHTAATLTFAGVGNITAIVAAPRRSRRLGSRDGRLGTQRLSIHQETVPFHMGETLIMHSDGVKTLRELDSTPQILFRPPLTVAATILAHYVRGTDDACVLIGRRRKPPAGVQVEDGA